MLCVQERVRWGLLVSWGCDEKSHSGRWGKGEEGRELYVLTVISGSDFLQDCK